VVILSGWHPPFSLWQACAGEPASAIQAGRAKPSRVAAGYGKTDWAYIALREGARGCHMECDNRRV